MEVNMKLLDEDKIIDLAELYKIFGDSTRIKIINILIDNELCVNQISEKTNVSQSAISHQLRILKSSKLVKYRKEGNSIFYSLADDHVEKIFKIGCEHVNEI
jgi:DNA-binding transcriptional ArsR family regulator